MYVLDICWLGATGANAKREHFIEKFNIKK